MTQPAIATITAAFRDRLDRMTADATGIMVENWLAVEQSLEQQILLLATELSSPPGGVKLTPDQKLLIQFQQAGYDEARIVGLLASQGIFKIPDLPIPQQKQIKDWQLAKLERYIQLLSQVQQQIEHFNGTIASNVIDKLMSDSAFDGLQDALTTIDTVYSLAGGDVINLVFNRLPIEAVENISAIARADQPLGQLLQSAYPMAAGGITNELIKGVALGINPRKTARNIINQGLAQGLNHILLVARDQQIRAYREASRQQFAASDVVVSYTRLAAHNSRVCPACIALDGTTYPTEELMPLHPQDRCVMQPNVVGFPPIPTVSGEDWLKTQPESVQVEILGKGRHAAWKAGKFNFKRMVTVVPNKIWGPSAQVTSLKDLLNGRGGFRPPGLPSAPTRPPAPSGSLPSLPTTQPPVSPLPQLDHENLKELDLHTLGPGWGKQANFKKQSYGGIVFDADGRVLLRKPTGGFGGLEWTFAKGRMDSPGEHPVEVALREVEQETGHDGGIVGLVPGQYKGEGTTNNYFLMKSNGFDKSKIDAETDDLIWATPAEAKTLIGKGTSKTAIKRDLAVLEASTKAYDDLLTGKATNDYLFAKPKKSTPTVITDFGYAVIDYVDFQAKNTFAGDKIAQQVNDELKITEKGVVITDDKGKLKSFTAYDDKDDDFVIAGAGVWGQSKTNQKTALINLGQIAAKDNKGVVVTVTDKNSEAVLKTLGFEAGGDGKHHPAGTYYLLPEWMKDWKKTPTKFKAPAPPPPPPPPADFDRKSIAGHDKLDKLLDHAKNFIDDPIAIKGVSTAIDKIQSSGQQAFLYGKSSGEFSGLISYEIQTSIVKVGSAGFADFDANLKGLTDVVKIAKQVGKDFVTFAPKGEILDQYLKWGFDINNSYANGASLILKKSNFDSWLKDPDKYGKRIRKAKPVAVTGFSSPSAGGSYTYEPPVGDFKATPKLRTVEPLPKPKSLPEPEPKGFPDDPNQLIVVRRLGGSTGAELVRDPVTGKQFVLKRGASRDHVTEEAHADAAYMAAGARVPEFKLYDTPAGPVKLAEFIEGDQIGDVLRKGGARAKKAKEQIKELFAVDAIFSNRDVIGEGFDNILVDKKGNVWRIDNGGSFRFRAQGGTKTDWDEFSFELWTMRDKAINRQTGEVFGDLDFYSISDQILQMQKRRQAILESVPAEVQETLARRMDHAVDIATTAKAMQPDNFKVEYADGFGMRRMELRKNGLVEQMPLAFDIKNYDKTTAGELYTGHGIDAGAVVDEDGRLFDRLRGRNSLVSQLQDFVHSIGGDYNLITNWAKGQASSSWSHEAQAFKYHVTENWLDKPEENFWWMQGKNKSRSIYQDEIRGREDVYDKTFQALHVFTQELLTKMDFPNKNDDGTVSLFRTEDSKVTKGINGLRPGDRRVTMPRGAVESTSLFDAVYIGTTELTRQKVPIHRVVGTYFMERHPGTGGDLLLGDGENEFVVILGGDIEFDYVASNRGASVAIAPGD